jgi:hypothetical protein
MANGVSTGSAGAGGLEGLVGGFLMGYDIRRQRTQDREDATERERLRRRQEMLDAQAAEDRQRQQAVGDLALREEYGLEFDPTAARDRVGNLRRGVGENLTAAGDPVSMATGAPLGFRSVGPSFAERENERLTGLRRGVGEFLGADPETRAGMFSDPTIIEGLAELGILDDVMPGAATSRTGIVRSGDRNILADLTSGETLREFDPIVSPGSSPLVTQRTIVQQALSEIDNIFEQVQAPGSTPEQIRLAQSHAEAVARRRGFANLKDLIGAAQRLNVSAGVLDGGAPGAPVASEDVTALLNEILANPELSEEEKELAREIAEGSEYEGQREALLRELAGT